MIIDEVGGVAYVQGIQLRGRPISQLALPMINMAVRNDEPFGGRDLKREKYMYTLNLFLFSIQWL